MRRCSRLEARTFTLGPAFKTCLASSAHACNRCSQLSRMRSRCRSCTCFTSASSTGRPASSFTPSAKATACGTRHSPASGASSTNHTPSGYSPATSAASCSDKRVLPVPPTLVRVTMREAARISFSSESSLSRPMKALSCAGRLSLRGGEATAAASAASIGSVKRKPRPGTVATDRAPRILRSVETCTCRLFSSTTSPGQTRSKSSSLVTTRSRWSMRAISTSKARAPNAAGRPSTSNCRSAGRISTCPKR